MEDITQLSSRRKYNLWNFLQWRISARAKLARAAKGPGAKWGSSHKDLLEALFLNVGVNVICVYYLCVCVCG